MSASRLSRTAFPRSRAPTSRRYAGISASTIEACVRASATSMRPCTPSTWRLSDANSVSIARNSWRASDGDRSSVHGSSGIAALN